MQTETITDLILQRSHFLRFVQRRVNSSAIAEDIIQNAYIRAIEQAPTLRSEESAAAWFYRILRNAVIDHYRHRAAEDRALERWTHDVAAEAKAGSQIPDQIHEIVCECIEEVLLTMKPTYSEILRSVDLAETSLSTFAKQTGITSGNAAVRIHRARQALKKRLTLVCGTCAKHGCINCTCS